MRFSSGLIFLTLAWCVLSQDTNSLPDSDQSSIPGLSTQTPTDTTLPTTAVDTDGVGNGTTVASGVSTESSPTSTSASTESPTAASISTSPSSLGATSTALKPSASTNSSPQSGSTKSSSSRGTSTPTPVINRSDGNSLKALVSIPGVVMIGLAALFRA